MINAESPWTREHRRIVDQRELIMPPSWVAKEELAPTGEREVTDFVWTSGADREAATRVVDLLAQARSKAVVCSFLLADRQVEDAMLEAAGRGVRVYVMLASENRLESEPGDGEFDRRVYEAHKAMLAHLGGRVLFRTSPNFHAKCVLVDPEDAPAGLLLTANLTSEALERNEELAVALSGDEVREAAALMRWGMWEAAEHELRDGRDFRAVKPLGCVAHPESGEQVFATTSKTTRLLDEAFEVIDSANEELVVASFGWDAEHLLTEYLVERARGGLKVTVLARMRPKSMPALKALADAGAEVLGFRWLHAKALWADSGGGLVMSANLEPHGLDEGFELGVSLAGERAEALQARLAHWAHRSRWKLLPRPKLGELAGKVRVWRDKTFTELMIKERLLHDLGVVEAPSADKLDIAPRLPEANYVERPAHEIEYGWQAKAPVLDRKAKQVSKQGAKGKAVHYDPPVYKEPEGRRVVAVRLPEQLAAAGGVSEAVGASAIVLARGVLL
ncbi:MAG: phospholipase D-like domain-containing protein [Gammaproteobacteria bacterium]|nr:phospholipase D-like domain-containing protein [Gammaproteobacteria bacterium]MDE0272712.1 phospholipase D-like domain-containing protein [Gammaproteobacteria bacterium]